MALGEGAGVGGPAVQPGRGSCQVLVCALSGSHAKVVEMVCLPREE